MGGVAFEKFSSAATLLPVQLLVDCAAFTFKALIDSGAEGNFWITRLRSIRSSCGSAQPRPSLSVPSAVSLSHPSPMSLSR